MMGGYVQLNITIYQKVFRKNIHGFFNISRKEEGIFVFMSKES